MTSFELFAQGMGVEITTDGDGLYTGMAKALAMMTVETILSEDPEVFELPWEEQKKLIRDRFLGTFPYMG